MGYFYGTLVRGIDLTWVLRGLPVEALSPDDYHITIVYVGDREPKGVKEQLELALGRFRCFEVRLSGFELLPSPAKPRVVAARVVDNGELGKVRSTIISVLAKQSIKLSDRYLSDFKPHVTIGYVKAKGIGDVLQEALEDLEVGDLAVRISEIGLIHAHGGRYSKVYGVGLSCG